MADPSASTSAAPADSAHAVSKLRHEFYQTEANVVVSVFIKNVKKEDLTSDIQPRSLSMTIRLPTGSETVFDLDPLAREIDPDSSSVKIMSTKIEATLRKKAQGIKWVQLEGNEESSGGAARHKGNWDAIAKSVDEEENKPADTKGDPNATGERELNRLFQKLYKDASDEQRMAMMKSYQESNGTALSTDWSDVKKGKVETKPPDGVIARDWSGKDKTYEARDKEFMSWASGTKK